jgi:hypothetical protein
MKRLMLGTVMALLLLGGPVAAECTYQGVAYSEGARVCMHRTMYICRGERWVKTAERCWEQCFTRASSIRGAAYSFGLAKLAVIQHTDNLAKHEQEETPEMQ